MSGPESSTEYEDTELGRDIAISEDTREYYDTLVEEEDSPFYDVQRKDLFMFAVGYGRKRAGRVPNSGRHALFNQSSLTEQQEWIIKSVAVYEERDPQVLRDEKLVYKIAREYANGGVEELHSQYVKPGDTLSEITTDIIQMGQGSISSE
ncbi:hypothetical protein [Halosimplex pelagicum]|uniref:hypothetical protein n=1 Tax=Halosimplex pelagicum TaxID=869886 RepID=UPI001C54C50F|nr:hypothetical protein [Halosimplex pelagicum]